MQTVQYSLYFEFVSMMFCVCVCVLSSFRERLIKNFVGDDRGNLVVAYHHGYPVGSYEIGS
jgi:hypothetical protein